MRSGLSLLCVCCSSENAACGCVGSGPGSERLGHPLTSLNLRAPPFLEENNSKRAGNPKHVRCCCMYGRAYLRLLRVQQSLRRFRYAGVFLLLSKASASRPGGCRRRVLHCQACLYSKRQGWRQQLGLSPMLASRDPTPRGWLCVQVTTARETLCHCVSPAADTSAAVAPLLCWQTSQLLCRGCCTAIREQQLFGTG